MSKNSALKIAAAVMSVCCAAACITTSQPPRFAIDLTDTSPVAARTPKEQLTDLESVLRKGPRDASHVEDVRLILQALASEEDGEAEAALKAWRQALNSARGPFGERAFNGWVKALARSQEETQDRLAFARLILEETGGGNASPWMIARDLTSPQRIADFIGPLIPDAAQSDSSVAAPTLNAPSRPGSPASDPLLTGTAREVCRYRGRLSPDWKTWRQTLNKDTLTYFDALILQCSGQAPKAAEQLTDVGARLGSHDATLHLALEAYSRAIKIRRDGGERDSVAPLFMPLMRLWKNPVITETSLGLSRQAFELRRIDDALAAARHQALINEVDVARSFASEAVDLAMAAQSQPWALGSEVRSQLAGSIAESYHLQAFRLAAEARDWSRAASLTRTAVQLEGLSSEWKLRLQWSLGLYEYLGGDFQGARKSWEQMLSDNSDEAFRPMLLFWIGRCHEKLGNASELNFYHKTLALEHPLSFYAVVGLATESDDLTKDWSKSFGDLEGLTEKLNDWQEADVAALRGHPVRGRLVTRSEILTEAKVTSFVNLSLDELQRSLDVASQLEADVRGAVFVSRLCAAAGYWLGSQSLTTKLSKLPKFWETYPEQVLVYFPKPWQSHYEKIGVEAGVNPDTLLAITRQESGFRADARSPANAFGLMQFTQPTARRISQHFNYTIGKLPESLLVPTTSIQLGAYYVKLLESNFERRAASVFAAYNAGEQAAETWKTRRTFVEDDEMLFVESIPYLETRSYVKNVMRNQQVYQFLRTKVAAQVSQKADLGSARFLSFLDY